MKQDVFQHSFANGITLLAERMEHVRSAAFNFLVSAGCAFDPPSQLGMASILADLITRGAGERDSRALTLALDNLGIDRDESVGINHMRFWGATLSRHLAAGLELYADILRRPHFPEDEMEAVQQLALQDLHSLEDEPRNKLMVELRKRHFPSPLGNDRRGTKEGIESITKKDVLRHYERLFQPRGMIVSVAGNFEWEDLRSHVERLFGDWKPGVEPTLTSGQPLGGFMHLPKETTQTQIGLAYPSVPIGHPEYYQAQGAVNVLSGGMSSRLFTEVREKRGLCYAVSAGYSTFKGQASIICYAGTTNERAQETLDVTLQELRRLVEGIEQDEVDRVQAGLKSALIMQEESTFARAGSLASDWYYLGRVRGVEEIQAAIDGLTPATIVAHLKNHPVRGITGVTLGPNALKW